MLELQVASLPSVITDIPRATDQSRGWHVIKRIVDVTNLLPPQALSQNAEKNESTTARQPFEVIEAFTADTEEGKGHRQRISLMQLLQAKILMRVTEPDTPPTEIWSERLMAMAYAVEQIPETRTEGDVFVCEDAEMGIAWRGKKGGVEIGARRRDEVEFMVWNSENDSSEEVLWRFKEDIMLPRKLYCALETL